MGSSESAVHSFRSRGSKINPQILPKNADFLTMESQNLGLLGFVFFEKPNEDAGVLGSFRRNRVPLGDLIREKDLLSSP